MSDPLRIWILKSAEPLPLGDKANRLMRMGMLARTLSSRGHQVTWWTSTFDHFSKKHLFQSDQTLRPYNGLAVRLIHSRGYQSHISISRFKDHREVAKRFSIIAENEQTPDVIICALPTLDMAHAGVEFGKRNSVPVIVDIRDWWPEVFIYNVPKPARWVARCLLARWFAMARSACAGAYALTGVTPEFVEWGIRKAGRPKEELDRDFPLAYSDPEFSGEELAAASAFWRDLGVFPRENLAVIAFFGSFGRTLDFRTVVNAARVLNTRGAKVQFVLCGVGDRLEMFRKMASDLPNIIFPGWVRAAQIFTLLKMSTLGLDPLPDRPDFLCNINNKAIQYLSAGVPVLSSPDKGVLHDLLLENNCGVSYTNGDAGGLAALIEQLIDDPERIKHMSENARILFDKHFVAERVYSNMADHLEYIAYTNRHENLR